MRKLGRLFVLIALLFCLPVSVAFAQGDDINEIKLINIDADAFPDVSVSFQAVDGDGVPVELRRGDITVYEDREDIVDVSLRDGDSVPSHILFLVDLGDQDANLSSRMWSNTDLLRTTLTQFGTEHFNEEMDTVSLYVTQGGDGSKLRPLLEESRSSSAFVDAVNRINFENIAGSRSYDTMAEAAVKIAGSNNADEINLAIVYLGNMNSGGAQGFSTLLRDVLPPFIEELNQQEIRFYAFHAPSSSTGTIFVPHLELLSSNTGGAYVRLDSGGISTVQVNTLYTSLTAYNQAYKATFRSESGTDEQREVIIVPFGEPPSSAESELRYEIDIQPPNIRFTVPDEVERSQQPNGTFDNNLLELVIEVVDWPDEFEREIDRVRLFVDGQRRPSINRPSDARVEIPFDLKVYEQPGETNTTLRVVVEDELGVETEVTENLVVDVIYLSTPPAPIPTIGGTSPPPPPTATPTPPVEGIPGCLPADCENISLGGLLSGLISLITLGLVLFMFFRFRKQEGGVGGAVRSAARAVSQTILGGAGARRQQELAKVKIVTAREDLRGQEVSIYEHVTRFGRNPQICDIQLFDEDDKSSVSGQHCTLQYDPGQQCFFLTDDNSSVGTYINGNPIAPNDPIRLQVGDEIVLGELVRRGAKLKLQSIANDLPPTQLDGMGDDGLLGTIYEDDLPALFGKTESDPPLSESFAVQSPAPPPKPTSGSNVIKKKPQKPKKSSDSRQTILETTADSDQIHVPDTTTQIYQQEEESADWMDDLE